MGAEQGIRRLEGYVYWQYEFDQARREAAAFCRQMPSLSTSERQRLEHLYADARVETARSTVRHIAGRCTELRAEYEARYRKLKLKTTVTALTAIAAISLGFGIAMARI
ncbi:hypothetical protein ACWEQ8_41405 [Streptomyces noursei]